MIIILKCIEIGWDDGAGQNRWRDTVNREINLWPDEKLLAYTDRLCSMEIRFPCFDTRALDFKNKQFVDTIVADARQFPCWRDIVVIICSSWPTADLSRRDGRLTALIQRTDAYDIGLSAILHYGDGTNQNKQGWSFTPHWKMKRPGKQGRNSKEQSLSWEANRSSVSQEIPPNLLNPKVHYRIHKSPPPLPVPSQIKPGHAHQPTSWRSILILTSYVRLDLPMAPFP